jgi:uncharacterized protein (TIGR03435 family)
MRRDGIAGKIHFYGALLFIAVGVFVLPAQSLFGQPGAPVQAPKDQAATVQLPEFEVASVKPAGSKYWGAFFTYPGGSIFCGGCPLQYLVMVAFDIKKFQILNAPNWTDTLSNVRYDIQAKPPESSPSAKLNPANRGEPPSQEQRQMLQALLIDRFQLKFHRERKIGPVYILTKGNNSLKLQVPKDKNASSWAGGLEGGAPSGSGIRGVNISMAQLAGSMNGWMNNWPGRPVLDQTGIQGSYDFEYKTDITTWYVDADVQLSIIESIKGIGLNLKTGKAPVESFVIDHVERPSAN